MPIKLIFPFLLISNWCICQLWSPVGAEWYYDITYAFHGDIDYHKVYCDSSILIKGKNCQKINIDYCACNNYYCKKLYTYKSQDTIFFYNEDVDTFEVLYNFNSQPGSFWQIRMKDVHNIIDTVTIVVDSIGSRNVNNRNFKSLYVSYYYKFKYSVGSTYSYIDKSEIVESLGDINLVINILSKSSFICDESILSSLRCYKDSLVGLYSTGVRETCDFRYKWVGIEDNLKSNNIFIYPNLVSDNLNIYLNDEDVQDRRYQIKCLDQNGKMVLSKEFSGQRSMIDLSLLTSGLYFYLISDSYKVIHFGRYIKL